MTAEGVGLTPKTAVDLHRRLLVLDGHCDSILDVCAGIRSLGTVSDQGHLDFPRARAAGVGAQVFALWPAPEHYGQAAARVLVLLDRLRCELAVASDLAELVTNVDGIDRARAQGRLAVVVGIEGGEALHGELALLRTFYDLGVRVLGLTWNHRNDLADGAMAAESGGGLTRFGRAVVAEANRLGVVLDGAHLSPAGLRDLLHVSQQPVLFSHGGCKALYDHPRNLSDAQLRALGRQGGVFGICFVRSFLGGAGAPVTVATVADHIEHAIAVAGVHSVGLGSDFDGTRTLPDGLEDITCLPTLTEELLRRGHGEQDLQLLLGENYLRVFAQVLR